jgi:Tfp pilus assembly protein PilO
MHLKFIEKLKNEAIPLLTLCTAVFIAVLALKLLTIPLYTNLEATNREVNQYRNLISSENGYLKIQSNIQMMIKQLEKELSLFSGSSTSNPNDLSAFLELLIDKARASEIRFIKMQPMPESESIDYSQSPVLLELSTSYHALGQFLSSLEKLPHMFRIDRISLEVNKTNALDVKILVTCLIPQQKLL